MEASGEGDVLGNTSEIFRGPSGSPTASPDFASHKRMCPSPNAAASSRPSGLKATASAPFGVPGGATSAGISAGAPS